MKFQMVVCLTFMLLLTSCDTYWETPKQVGGYVYYSEFTDLHKDGDYQCVCFDTIAEGSHPLRMMFGTHGCYLIKTEKVPDIFPIEVQTSYAWGSC